MTKPETSMARELSVAAIFVTTALLVFYASDILHGRNLWQYIGSDHGFYFFYYPFAVKFQATLRDGYFPLWFSTGGFGVPMHGSWIITAFNPTYLPFLLFDFLKGITAFILLRIWLMGITAWLFARRSFDLSRYGAAMTAISFMFSGFAIDRHQMWDMNVVWLTPLFALVLGNLAKKSSINRIIASFVVGGVVLLAGHIPQIIYTFFFAGAWWLYRVVTEKDSDRTSAPVVVGVVAVSMLLSAAQVLPGFEVLATYMSHHVVDNGATGYNVRGIFTMTMPWLAGDRISNPLTAFTMPGLGLIPVALAVFAVTITRRIGRPWGFPAAYAVVFIGLAYVVPPFAYIKMLPIFDRMANHVTAMATIALCVGLLAGKSVDAISEATEMRASFLRFAKYAAPILLLLCIEGYWVIKVLKGNSFIGGLLIAERNLIVHWAIVSGVSVAMFALLIAAVLFMYKGRIAKNHLQAAIILLAFAGLRLDYLGWKLENPGAYEQLRNSDAFQYLISDKNVKDRNSPYRAMSDFVPVNLTWLAGLNDIRAVAVFQTSSYFDFMCGVNGFDVLDNRGDYDDCLNRMTKDWFIAFPIEKVSAPIGNLSGVKYVVASKGASTEGLDPLFSGAEATVYENNKAMPRFFMAEGARFFVNENAMLKFMLNEPTGWERTALFSKYVGASKLIFENRRAPAGGTVSDLDYRDEAISLKVSSPVDGFLVQTDIYHPGWEAFVNGQPTRILKSDYLFRAIPVPAGDSVIKLRYRPAAFRIGLWANVTALLFVGVVALVAGRKK